MKYNRLSQLSNKIIRIVKICRILLVFLVLSWIVTVPVFIRSLIPPIKISAFLLILLGITILLHIIIRLFKTHIKSLRLEYKSLNQQSQKSFYNYRRK